MASWNDLPHELKRPIVDHFLENLLDEAGEQVWERSIEPGVAMFLPADHTMPSMREQVDNFLAVAPEMIADLLEQCRMRGVEIQGEWEEDETHDHHWLIDYHWIKRRSEVAFRLEWHIWCKDSEYLRRKAEAEVTRRKLRKGTS